MLRSKPRHPWLSRLQHDLVKRLLWAARDCRELGRPPTPGELVATLYDASGQPVEAATLWATFREDAPPGVALERFEAALRRCVEAALRNDLEGVLELEREFELLQASLASSLNETGGARSSERER